jgi:hypothetical protein
VERQGAASRHPSAPDRLRLDSSFWTAPIGRRSLKPKATGPTAAVLSKVTRLARMNMTAIMPLTEQDRQC